jgi:hypothetical protein
MADTTMQHALYHSVLEATTYHKEMYLWKLAETDMDDETRKQKKEHCMNTSRTLRRNYGMHICATHIYMNLGERLTENNRHITVLDVGSRAGRTAAALFTRAPSYAISYTSIDSKINPGAQLPIDIDLMHIGAGTTAPQVTSATPQLIIELLYAKGIDHEHHSFDPLHLSDAELKEKLSRKYDVILIDNDMREQEVQVYEKYRPFMKEEHICVLKRCLNQGCCTSYSAELFLVEYMKRGLIRDYYAQEGSLDTCDDMILVMQTTPMVHRTYFTCQSLTEGLFLNYVAWKHHGILGEMSRGPFTERNLEFIPREESKPQTHTETAAPLDR